MSLKPSFSFSLPEAAQKFNITLRFVNTATADQQADFTTAADRWEGLIHGDVPDGAPFRRTPACIARLPDAGVHAAPIDDILINVLLQPIDGPGNILGAAGACFVRTADGLPVFGLMFFDVDDLDFLETNNLLDEVIVHEMGHVLGFSRGFFNLTSGPAPAQPAGLPDTTGSPVPGQDRPREVPDAGRRDRTVPIEGFTGRCGGGTALSHWDEGTFFNELMTGFINGASANFINPMSPMTSGALADLGYVVTPQGEAYMLRPHRLIRARRLLRRRRRVAGLNIAAQEIIIEPVGRVK